MNEKTITIRTLTEDKLVCEVCGKDVSIGRMMCDGPFQVLCVDCEKKAVIVIKKYKKFLMNIPLSMVVKILTKSDVTEKSEAQK
jgi:hypothetical protein